MLKKSAENTVFRRYNTAVVFAFVIIVFIALTAASLRYYGELSEHKQQSLSQLTAQATQLNAMLLQGEQAIIGIQNLAQFMLKYPDELYAKTPPLRQEGALFFLDLPNRSVLTIDERISGNITGFGDINTFSLLKKQEIAMANALTPAFVTAQKVLSQANWFYYVSAGQFVNMFPWIGRDSWRFSDRMLTNAYTKKIQALGVNNNKVIWSSPYIDAAGTGMNFSLGIGVYRQSQMLGAVVIDISLSRLQKSILTLSSEEQGLVLLNNKNDILIFKQKNKEPLSYQGSWQKLLPEALQYLQKQDLSQLSKSSQIGDWFVEKETLSINGWTLLKFQPYAHFISPVRNHFIFMFTILLVGLLVFLMLVNGMTRRSFIKPTHDFISHIEFCAQGDPGKIKANADWLHWFMLVEDIFTQNRSLLIQLKEQNVVLDSRVLEKTKALLETSTKHQRDYALLRSVMNAIPELIIFNDPNGKLMGCNQAFEQLTDQLESTMLGIEASQFMPTLLAYEMDKLYTKSSEEYPKQSLVVAGEESYQVFCNQFTNEQNEVLGTITILQNVTEQQATQSALEMAKNQAEYANKVKIQFLANMSHEIRTPINAIQGMINLLIGTALDTRQHHYLSNAKTASFSLLHLIDELLDLSKIEAGKMVIVKEEINLPTVIDTALKLNTAAIHAKKLTIKVALAVNVPSLLISDSMRLVQVLSNLFNNAIKFTEEGGIDLSIKVFGVSERRVLLRFSVKDTGIGIAKENQAHLFEAFSQADISMTRNYGGSGLGLSICQQIVHLLGGEITVKSDLGQGCEFSFILPFTFPSKNKKSIKSPDIKSNERVSIHLCSIKNSSNNQILSDSCIETIESLSWFYHDFDDFNGFNNLIIKHKQPQDKVVLLMDEQSLAQHLKQKLPVTNINLIGLCQPAMLELKRTTCHQLDHMSVPYILLDTPIYRFALEQIAQELIIMSTDNLPDISAGNRRNVNNKSHRLIKTIAVESTINLANIKVLLVEDNVVNQLVAKELLKSMKANVVIAENGQQAIELIEKTSFDVVLMDIQMPVMDGLTATKTLRKNEKYQSLPIIAMTAHARAEDKQRSLAAGMNQHIAKPFTAKLLLKSILEVIK